jgi:DNA-binding NarL/FixJ family response regulator
MISRMIDGGGVTVANEITLKVFVVFADSIYARGLQASLAELPEVREVYCVVGVAHARAHRELPTADIVLLDYELHGAAEFAEGLSALSPARVLLCTRRAWNDELAHAAETASGVLPAGALTPEAVAVAVRAINNGVGVLGLDLLRELCRDRPHPGASHNGAHRSEHLTRREHAVLVLVAEGVPSREIAQRLAYSERTVKNVLHDVLTKLDARTRSHAVAVAVREGII